MVAKKNVHLQKQDIVIKHRMEKMYQAWEA